MEKMRKAQGSLEYLIIISAVLVVTGVVIMFVTGTFGGQQSSAQLASCKKAAADCNLTHVGFPDDSCSACESACSDPKSGVDVVSADIKCGVGCGYCKLGWVDQVFAGNTLLPFIPVSKDGAEDLTHWGADYGAVPVQSTDAKVGTYSVQTDRVVNTLAYGTCSPPGITTGCIDGMKYGRVNFWFKSNSTAPVTIILQTYNPSVCDGSGYGKYIWQCRYDYSIPSAPTTWTYYSLSIPDDFHVPYNTPDPSMIYAFAPQHNGAGNVTFYVDGFYYQRTA